MPNDSVRLLSISPVSFRRGHKGVKLECCGRHSFPASLSSAKPPRLVGTPPAGCPSPSVNKALIGCYPVRTGPPEKSNYWLRGFKAAQGRLMKGDKPRTVSRIPAGRPRRLLSRGATESPGIKGIRRERGSGRTAGPVWPPAGRADLGWGRRAGTPGFPARSGRGLGQRPPAPGKPGSPRAAPGRRTGRASLAAGLASAVACAARRGGAALGDPISARLCAVRLNQAGLCGMGADASSRW